MAAPAAPSNSESFFVIGTRLFWAPNDEEDISTYEVSRATTVDGDYEVLATIDHDVDGSNYLGGRFFYVDVTGTSTHFYTVTAINTGDERSAATGPFQASAAAPVSGAQVKVDHNYGGYGALKYLTPGGAVIEAAFIRVYLKSDFDLGNTDNPIARTQTESDGSWTNPVYLTTGFTYVVQFAKVGLYGPDHTEIIV